MSAVSIPIIEDGHRLVQFFDAAVVELKMGALAGGCDLTDTECIALLQTMETVRLYIVEVQEDWLNGVDS